MAVSSFRFNERSTQGCGQAPSIAQFTYVSDLISALFHAESTREIVREECFQITTHLPASLARSLEPSIRYYGGKCMAFPAVWLVRGFLGLDDTGLRQLVRHKHATIFFSLTTSIADDMIDQDENVSLKDLVMMYCLFLDILKFPSMSCERWAEVERALLTPVMEHMVAEQERPRPNVDELRTMEKLAVKRIGNLYRLIAQHLLEDCRSVDLAGVRKVAGSFGEWCCRLDDIIDLQKDVQSGRFASLPVVKFLETQDRSVVLSVSGIMDGVRRDPNLLAACVEQQVSDLLDLSRLTERLGAPMVAETMRVGSQRLRFFLDRKALRF